MLILPHPRKLWTPRLPFAIWDKAGGGIVDGAAGIVDCADCPCDAVPCTDCDPGGTGSAPSGANVTINAACLPFGGAADPFDDNANPVPYSGFASVAAHCSWAWTTGIDNLIVVTLWFIKTNTTTITFPDSLGAGGCANITAGAGEWVIHFTTNYSQDDIDEAEWFEKTAGFDCSAATGKISGTHTFGAECSSQNDCVGLTPTITVLP